MYRIEIWVYGNIRDEFENKSIKKVLKWYKENWQLVYNMGGCSFNVFKGDILLTFEEEYKLGFHKE